MSIKCRVWWPKELSASEQPSHSSSSSSSSTSLLLFGWFVSCSSTCIDAVVAFAYDEAFLSHHSSDSAIQEAVHHTNGGMPVTLQDKSRFSILGRCVPTFGNSGHVCKSNMVDCEDTQPCKDDEDSQNNKSRSLANSRRWSCGCLEYDHLLQKHRHASLRSSIWIQLVHDAHNYSSSEICWVPALHHLHWNGIIFSQAELHVVVYETPRFGIHHFLVNVCSSRNSKCLPKRPKWVHKLYQKPRHVDLDTVLVAINSSAAANMSFDRDLGLQRSISWLSVVYINFIWRPLATFVASFCTLLYIVLQLLHKLAVRGSKPWTCIAFADIFSNTWKSIQFRCYQILYWPIFLNETGLRSRACVEYAEKAALRRHSLWSSVVVDIVVGNLVGLVLLIHQEAICKWISTLVNHFTDDVLRTGCVWLMGVPAGFKLNTELAGVLGIISLNAIQIWSTLSLSATYILYCVIKVFALSGMLLGVTIPAALLMDVIAIAVVHVSTLHQLMSLLYSLQIQALTALWRLFRGRKWNPLRQRLDSYEYSVEQHIVGSLLFTPLLLLLPTSSVFYIFFTIINSTVIFFHILIEAIISVIHATPYTKILIWLVRSERFPCGIWFDIVHCEDASVASSVDGLSTGTSQACKHTPQDKNMDATKSRLLISFLHSNISTFGQVVFPHYKNIFSGVHRHTIAAAISGILTGKSISATLGSELPPKMPWMSIPCKDYWCICYDAVLACMNS